jgi:hypothetical protein
MNRSRFTYLVALAITGLTVFAPLGSETQVVLKNIKGKVEIKSPGATAWTAVSEGLSIGTLTTISTGFDSSVTIAMDKNTVFVQPLTRMTIDKLVEDKGTVSTNCYLRVGSVKASVKSAEGVKQDFKVQSPYSTASVRGTGFDFDGLNLEVLEGLVALLPEGAEEGDEFLVPAGYSAVLTVGADGKVGGTTSSDRDSLRSGSTVTTSDSGTAAGEFRRDRDDAGIQYGSVTVTIEPPPAAE